MLKINGLATIDKITTYDKLTKVKLTSSSIGKSGKEYTDFKGFATLWNKAHEMAVDLCEGDSIKILDMGVTTGSKSGTYYTNVNIYDMEIIKNEQAVEDFGADDTVDELPFS